MFMANGIIIVMKKGNQENYRRFDKEEDACNFLFKRLMSEIYFLKEIKKIKSIKK